VTATLRSKAARARATAIFKWVPIAAMAAVAAVLGVPMAHAQGCIVARSPDQVVPGIGQSSLPTNQGGYLQPGHFQATIGERHQFSYLHYVGDVYQEYRTEQRTQVQNRINLLDLDVVWQWTPRVSLEVNAPVLFASRKQESSPIEYQASGLGDTIVAANAWLWSPLSARRGNVSVGLGVLMPTGNDDVENTVASTSGGVTTKVTTPVDYSIQPGNGGWGLAMQWQGFRAVGQRFIAYTDGDYIASQGGTNGVQRGATLSTTQPLNNYVARSDQYLLEAGLAFPVARVKGLVATVGPRDEGVPAYNLFPNSNAGFRRPGFAVSAGPGLEYLRGSSILTANIFKAIHRDRTSSYPDSVYGGHGDAAFANYVWLATYTYRF
jgi:hypothetical protein